VLKANSDNFDRSHETPFFKLNKGREEKKDQSMCLAIED
jgi:hypothetical protein